MILWLRAVWHDIVLRHHVTHVESPWPAPDVWMVGHCTCGGVITIRRTSEDDELIDHPDRNTWAINAEKVTCPGLRARVRRILRDRERSERKAREVLKATLPIARLL